MVSVEDRAELVPIDEPIHLRNRLSDVSAVDALVLPTRVDESGVGVYRSELVTAAKELRASGVSADYLDGPDDRTWQGLLGDVAVNIAIGLGTSGAVAVFGAWLRTQLGSGRVVATVARIRRKPDGSQDVLWYHVEGNGEAVAAALAPLEHDDEDS
jgi:hypothetical protein